MEQDSRREGRIHSRPQDNALNKRHLLASLGLHLIAVIVLAFSWSFSSTPEVVVPKYLEARVATEADLAPLREKKQAEERARQQEADKRRRAQEEKKRQADEAKRRKQEEVKKKEAARKETERKKALMEKKKKEAERKKQEADKKKAEQERERKQEQLEKQRLEKELKERERLERERIEKERQQREQALAERLAQAEAEAERRADEMARQSELAALEASETERYLGLIKRKIENRWHKPPSGEGLSVILAIRLLPTGELAGVRVKLGSGSSALDQSALVAVRSVKKFPVPESTAVFEKNFRSFDMKFTP